MRAVIQVWSAGWVMMQLICCVETGISHVWGTGGAALATACLAQHTIIMQAVKQGSGRAQADDAAGCWDGLRPHQTPASPLHLSSGSLPWQSGSQNLQWVQSWASAPSVSC